MAENAQQPDIILQDDEKPVRKRVQYTQKLLELDKTRNLTQRIFNKLKGNQTKYYSQTDLVEKIGNHKTDRLCREYVKDLAETKVLRKEQVLGTPPNEYPVYSIDKDKLRQLSYESNYIQEQLPLFIDLIKNNLKGKTVTNEIYIENKGLTKKITRKLANLIN